MPLSHAGAAQLISASKDETHHQENYLLGRQMRLLRLARHTEVGRGGDRARCRGWILGLGGAAPSCQTFSVASLFLKGLHSLAVMIHKPTFKQHSLNYPDSPPTLTSMYFEFTCRRNLFAISVSGETSNWRQVGQTWSSESSRALRIPGQEMKMDEM